MSFMCLKGLIAVMRFNCNDSFLDVLGCRGKQFTSPTIWTFSSLNETDETTKMQPDKLASEFPLSKSVWVVGQAHAWYLRAEHRRWELMVTLEKVDACRIVLSAVKTYFIIKTNVYKILGIRVLLLKQFLLTALSLFLLMELLLFFFFPFPFSVFLAKSSSWSSSCFELEMCRPWK